LRLGEVCDAIVVVIAPDAPAPTVPERERIRIARDATEGQGPLAGVHAGLRDVTTTFAIVAAGDMPDLQPPVLLKMLEFATDADAVALADASDLRPLPCVVRVQHARDVAQALLRSDRRSVRVLLDELRVNAIDESTWTALDPARRTLFDVDEPADLST
jgi:molybdenum cofactor guanylyltransferase